MDTQQRWIMHLDMDAFFASVEQLDNPAYRGKPVIIGGSQRGVVATASYEARAFGVRSAMPIFQAKKLCPHGLYIASHHKRYEEKSHEIMEVLRSFSPLVEAASIDEAYVDLTGLKRVFEMDVVALVHTIQQRVYEVSGLTCSVGLAPVKFLAKIASDMQKPNGVSLLLPEAIPSFLQGLAVQKIPGVGKRTLGVLQQLGVATASDVMRYPEDFWQRKLGKFGGELFRRAQGIDNRPVVAEYERKSESAENTFAENTSDMNVLTDWLLQQAERVATSLRKQKLAGRTITLKVKYADFTQVTRSKTLPNTTNSTMHIYDTACALLRELKPTKKIRLIGVGVSQFGQLEQQLSLFDITEQGKEEKDVALDETLDALRGKFGFHAITRGKLFDKL